MNLPPAIANAIRKARKANGKIFSGLVGTNGKPLCKAEPEHPMIAQTKHRAMIEEMAKRRLDAIAEFCRAELETRIEGGADLDDQHLLEKAVEEGYVVKTFPDESEPGIECIVLFKGEEAVTGLKLRVFPEAKT